MLTVLQSAFRSWLVLFEASSSHLCCYPVVNQLGDQDAVVALEKTPITEDTLTELFRGSRLTLDMKNDIYSTYRLQPPAHLNGLGRKSRKLCQV